MKIVIVTGGFDPLHSGHIEYFKAAKALGDMLIVGINSDEWLIRKKGRPFMPWVERNTIVANLDPVDATLMFDDSNGSAVDAIRKVRELYPTDDIIFANGGDRTKDNIPEMVFDDVEFVFGVGGEDKKNSSSWILEDWKAPKTERPWGYYRVLHTCGDELKLKELTVEPNSCLSMQRHSNRAELWFVAEGVATVYTLNKSTDTEIMCTPVKHQRLIIQLNEWHQLCNETDKPLKLIEIQYGTSCTEDDIERQ